MKVLVATASSQGRRDDDFNWCVEGELVWLQEPCGRDLRGDATSCGCGRGFSGIASHRSTTTALVRDLTHMTWSDYVEALRGSFVDGGWPGEWAEDEATQLLGFAAAWDEGAVIERHLSTLRPRFDRARRRLLPRLDSEARR